MIERAPLFLSPFHLSASRTRNHYIHLFLIHFLRAAPKHLSLEQQPPSISLRGKPPFREIGIKFKSTRRKLSNGYRRRLLWQFASLSSGAIFSATPPTFSRWRRARKAVRSVTSSISFRLILLDSTEMDVDGEHECYEMETDAFSRPRGR